MLILFPTLHYICILYVQQLSLQYLLLDLFPCKLPATCFGSLLTDDLHHFFWSLCLSIPSNKVNMRCGFKFKCGLWQSHCGCLTSNLNKSHYHNYNTDRMSMWDVINSLFAIDAYMRHTSFSFLCHFWQCPWDLDLAPAERVGQWEVGGFQH